MTTPAPTVVKTITEAEIRDVTHYCHWIAARQGRRSVVMYWFPEYTPFELLTALRMPRAIDGIGSSVSLGSLKGLSSKRLTYR